eukprot:GEMP01075447.1.p3 GENE.GEMP01075447.1~~GEMP01075447.1.p3  ORF type:complete len:101 (+),score=21.28 GEMP01075447.1:65-367(+)
MSGNKANTQTVVTDQPYSAIASIMQSFRTFTFQKDNEMRRVDSIPVPNRNPSPRMPVYCEPYEMEVIIDFEDADVVELEIANSSNNEVEVEVEHHDQLDA